MRRFLSLSFALIVALALPLPLVRAQSAAGVAPAPATGKSGVPSGVREAAERVTSAQIKKDLYHISSDEMAGRDTPSPGLDATAKFLAERLKPRSSHRWRQQHLLPKHCARQHQS